MSTYGCATGPCVKNANLCRRMTALRVSALTQWPLSHNKWDLHFHHRDIFYIIGITYTEADNGRRTFDGGKWTVSSLYYDHSVTWHVHWWHTALGKFDWGFWYVIIFLHVQLWIRQAAVSYNDKKVRTVASPAVRSVNKSRDTRNCVQNEPEYAICVIFTTLIYYRALGLILYDLVWEIRHGYTRLDDGHCDVSGHRKMGAVGTMVTTHENFVMIRLFKGTTFFCVLQTLLEMKRSDGFHIRVLSIS